MWVCLALVIPRAFRFFYPAVWIEDDPLLETTLAVSRGLQPYTDFTLAQMPLLEWIGAAYVRVFGASLHAMEILNAVAIYGTSVLIALAGRRAVGASAAIAGAVLFASSSLVFRYHVWAREFFVTALVLAAAMVMLSGRLTARAEVTSVAALAATAAAIKLTAAVSVLGLLLFMAFGQHRPGRATAAALAAAAMFGAFALLCYLRYGYEFVFQSFLFHFLKGTVDVGLGYAATILDVLAPLSIAGAAVLLLSRSAREAAVVWWPLGALILFYGVVSPTAWGHNYLELLPWIAMLAGAGLMWLIRESRALSWKAPVAAAAIAAGLWVAPFNGENASRGSVYGLGFLPRREVRELADRLRAATRPAEEVVAPSFIAFEAQRLQRMRFPENYGVIREGEQRVLRDGFFDARATFGRRNFFDLINETSAYWNDQFIAATAPGGAVNAVILDSPIQFLPLVNATDDALTQSGFHAEMRTAHYTLWLRAH